MFGSEVGESASYVQSAPCVSGASSAGSGRVLGGGSSSAVGTFHCVRCRKVWPMADMFPSRKHVCYKDGLSYKALSERWKKHRNLKVAWGNKGDEDRKDWYVKQQQLPANAKRKFEEIEYTETAGDEACTDDFEVDKWMTFSDFEDKGLLRQKPGGQIEQEWIDIVTSRTQECRYARKEWLIPRVACVERHTGARQSQTSNLTRTATNLIPEDVEQLRRSGDVAPQPHIDVAAAEQPSAPKPADVLGRAISREVESPNGSYYSNANHQTK